MLVTPALVDPGLTWITSDEHDACSPLLGIILPLKYNPPSTPLAPLLVPLGPSPVRQRAIQRPLGLLSLALMYE